VDNYEKQGVREYAHSIESAPTGAQEVRQGGQWQHPTGRRPHSVDVVALGYSLRTYMHHQLRKNRDPKTITDEVWTINRGIRCVEADMAFILDELPDEIKDDPAYGHAIKAYKNPILTTEISHHAPTSIAYPAEQIMDCLIDAVGVNDPYWHNSMPMVLAYAWFIGVQELTLWGCDYQGESGLALEDDRANLEYWVGMCRALGMRIGVPAGTTLLNQRKHNGELYVYGLRDQRRAAVYLGLTYED